MDQEVLLELADGRKIMLVFDAEWSIEETLAGLDQADLKRAFEGGDE